MKTLIGIFIIFHGLVHLIYMGQSWRFFEMRKGMKWPDDSWFYSRFMGNKSTRLLAGILCFATTCLYVISGIGLLINKLWWHEYAISAIILSSFVYVIFWDGRLQKVNDQGGYGILFNIAILVATLFY